MELTFIDIVKSQAALNLITKIANEKKYLVDCLTYSIYGEKSKENRFLSADFDIVLIAGRIAIRLKSLDAVKTLNKNEYAESEVLKFLAGYIRGLSSSEYDLNLMDTATTGEYIIFINLF